MEFICSVRLCKVVSVLCNVTMDAYSRRHQCPGSHAGIYMCRMYEAVFQIMPQVGGRTGCARCRRFLMPQALGFVCWTLIDINLVCSSEHVECPRMFHTCLRGMIRPILIGARNSRVHSESVALRVVVL